MTRKLIWSRRSERDLAGIEGWIAKDDPRAAIRFLNAAEKAGQRLVEQPWLGGEWEAPSGKSLGLRVWPIPRFRRYLVFYRVTDRAVEIVRVLHGARDLERLLEE